HLHPWYQREFGYKPGDFPTAEWIYQRSISLPIWADMTDDQIDRVANTLLTILDGARRQVEV
ncbi:MAG: UDP-4-amino-4,6-dideoxy-N-acetyl-beta-L-altrosamine transaminase, partial [Actinobacteria bacterium]